MNKVFMIGNLTRDPELTETSGGVQICRFSLAVKRGYRNGDGDYATDFFNCIAWRGLGENIARYAHKGNKLAISGSIELRNYEDSQGAKKTAVDIIVQDVEFLTPRQSDSYDERGHDVPKTQGKHRPKFFQTFDDDSDIPF
ncbi:MAG: single-stranded DNA-binding protein [Roseburia sp.]|nr:single-stranded DNA-binding protein [Roseburia sp.]